jgi:hypothetical protein
MMTVPTDEAERLAEIFREIFALSETNQPNHSQSTPVDDSIKSLDRQSASGTPETSKGKQASDKRGNAEEEEPRR